MKRCRKAHDRVRKAWLRHADEWDGQAIVYDPIERRNVCANWYHADVAGPMMASFDRLPTWERQRLAQSVEGFGNEAPTIRR